MRPPPPVPVAGSLVVHNQGRFEVDVYAVTEATRFPSRLGTVAGTSTATFPLHPGDLQSTGGFVALVHALGSGRSWTSDPVTVGPNVVAELNVVSDERGDCSGSKLRAIPTNEARDRAAPVKPHA